MDLCSRRLVGWAIADHMRTELILDALHTARSTRGSLAGAVFQATTEPNTALEPSPKPAGTPG
jgi:transposase InsO family protein